jgi:hypothetical protein
VIATATFRCKNIAEGDISKLLFADSESESEHEKGKWSKNKAKF